MESYNTVQIIKKIFESKIEFFNIKTLHDILDIKKDSTFYNTVKRLTDNGILKKLERNKYILKDSKISNLLLANFLYIPSYISFETALNIHGVLSQFPYEISSATTKKSLEKKIDNTVFSYSHLQKSLFWGYQKNNFLIAEAEKALLDLAYVSGKGFKKLDLEEYNFSEINKTKIKKYLGKYPETRQFLKIKHRLINKLNL